MKRAKRHRHVPYQKEFVEWWNRKLSNSNDNEHLPPLIPSCADEFPDDLFQNPDRASSGASSSQVLSQALRDVNVPVDNPFVPSATSTFPPNLFQTNPEVHIEQPFVHPSAPPDPSSSSTSHVQHVQSTPTDAETHSINLLSHIWATIAETDNLSQEEIALYPKQVAAAKQKEFDSYTIHGVYRDYDESRLPSGAKQLGVTMVLKWKYLTQQGVWYTSIS